jgi:WD40 repeat protein
VNLGQFLTVFETPDDDLGILEELRAKGSCEWLVQEPSFRHWRDTLGPKFFWLHANPATGKSVLAAHVVNHLRNMNLSCSYFFFNHGDNSKCTLSSFLRSMAYQMALNNVGIRDVILAMQQDAALDKSDHRSLWRRLYLQGILQENFVQPHYWVIDALDECKNFAELIPLMAKVEESFPLRIFLTSRTSLEIQKYLQPLAGHLVVTPVSMFAVMEDIKLYVSSNTNELPWQDAAARQDLINKILEKSAGCFLWVKLVVEELSKIHGAADLKKVLEDVPPGMENLYHRTLKLMSTAPYGKNLAKAILTWTVCAARPLTVNELKAALLLDINDTFTNLEKSIISLCGQLVYIDSQSRVQVIHQTAKDFLLSDELESEFRVHKDDGNRRLAEACLTYLTDDEMKAPRSRRGTVQILAARSPFASYACAAFYHHINATHSNVHGILRQLSKFLGSSNVLTWIEINARNSTLGNLIGAAKTMKNYLQRRAKHTSPLGRDVQIVESWSTDLIRIVAKFGSNLLLSPASIYHLIPPFCPPETAPYKQFGETPRGLVISGLSTTSWDDCVSCITYGSDATASVACDDRLFAVGLVSGKIMIYNRTTCQKIRVLQHGELAKVLTFSASSRLLACSGLRNIRVWNILSGEEVFATKTTAACLALSIIDNDRTLLGAAKDNHLSTWDIFSGTRDSCVNWHESLAGQSTTTATRAPTVAAFSRELNLLGVVYRGEPILLWDLENDSILGYCGKAVQAKAGQRLVNTAVVDMVFNPIPATSLLAAAYQDGDLVLFDPLEGKILESVVAEAQNLASSPDGRTLASGNTSGTIQVYDFETLRVLYRINSWGYGIKSLAFSSDSLQFVDIRGSQCNVWEPSVLVRQNSDEEHSDSDAISTVTKEISSATIEELISITTMVSHPTMDFIFCGKDDGTVMLFESIYGKLQRKLYSHIEDISVTLLRLSSNVLVSADSSGRLMAHKLSGGPRNLSCNELLFDLSLERAITDVLLHPDLSCILISTPGLEMLLSMDGERINTHTLQPERTRKWCLHPIDHSNLIAAAGHRVEVYDWNLLHAGHTTPVSVLETSTPAVFHIEAVNQYPGSNHIGIKMSDPSATRSRTRTMLFEASMLEVEEDLSASTQSSFLEAHHQSQFRALERSIEHIFNYIGTRIIFLDRTGWICSVDLDMFTGDYYMRHFFIPSDWLSINPELIGTFTHRSDFTFAQRDEIAVVKRGFDYSEQVPLTQESTREEVGVRLTKAEEE